MGSTIPNACIACNQRICFLTDILSWSIDTSNIVVFIYKMVHHVDGLVQDWSNSIAKALELLQSCTKPLISGYRINHHNDIWEIDHTWNSLKTSNTSPVRAKSLAPGTFDYSLKLVNFTLISTITILSIIYEIAITPHWWLVNIGSGNGLVPSGTKPLLEPMLT